MLVYAGDGVDESGWEVGYVAWVFCDAYNIMSFDLSEIQTFRRHLTAIKATEYLQTKGGVARPDWGPGSFRTLSALQVEH